MLAAVLTIAFSPALPMNYVASSAAVIACLDASSSGGNLHERLMSKFTTMNAAGTGIFHEDVSCAVAPMFPLGQTFDRTSEIARRQGLGNLRPFRGKQMPGPGRMFVARTSLMNKMFSDVYVVVDFDFDGPDEQHLVLKKVEAFLDASNM